CRSRRVGRMEIQCASSLAPDRLTDARRRGARSAARGAVTLASGGAVEWSEALRCPRGVRRPPAAARGRPLTAAVELVQSSTARGNLDRCIEPYRRDRLRRLPCVCARCRAAGVRTVRYRGTHLPLARSTVTSL